MGRGIKEEEFLNMLTREDMELIEYKTFHENAVVKSKESGLLHTLRPKTILKNNPLSFKTCHDQTEWLKFHFKKIHGDTYDYSKTIYENYHKKLTITCKEHGDFEQSYRTHLMGAGCLKCAGLERFIPEKFINKSKEIHGEDTYDYSKMDYQNMHDYIILGCKEHGDFSIKPTNHIHKKQGCPSCFGQKQFTLEKFLNDAKAVHGDLYDYSEVVYRGVDEDINIICKKHGKFTQRPYHHIKAKSGCPRCNIETKISYNEAKIALFLDSHNITYEQEKRFESCKFKRKLPFDFYLPDYNSIIEFDGKQHFKAIDFFGGEEGLKQTQIRDEFKNNWCEENDIKLLRIPYFEEASIEKTITKFLNLPNIDVNK